MPGTALQSTLSTVIDCDGTLQKIETVQNAGETIADFVARHKAAVAAGRSACGGTATVQPSTFNTPVDCNGTVSDVFSTQDAGQSFDAFVTAHNANVRTAVNDCP